MRLAEIAAAARGGRAALVRVVVRVAVLVLCAGALWWGVLALRGTDAASAIAVTVTGGAAVTVAFAVAPLGARPAGARDPAAFVVFGLRPGTVATATLLNRMLSLPVALLAPAAAAVVLLWWAHGVPAGMGVTGAVLGTLTCVLVAAVCSGIVRGAPRTRRVRRVILLLALALGVGIPVLAGVLALTGRGGMLGTIASGVLADSPMGAAWALPGRWASGDPHAWVSAAVALATVLAGMAGVVATVVADGRLPRRPADRAPARGWFAVMPGTPAGVVAARSLTYWLRDGRYVSNLLIVPVMAGLVVVPLLVVGVSPAVALLLPAPVAALFFGWLPHNDVAYDSTALWVHVAGGVRGRADRIGRLVPTTLVATPVVAVAVAAGAAAHGGGSAVAALIGACASLLLAGLGLSSVASAAMPYPATRPGDGFFRQPQRSTSGALAQATVLVATVAVSSPTLWLAWRAATGDARAAPLALGIGLATGIGVLVAGVCVGGWVFDRRGTTLLEMAEAT